MKFDDLLDVLGDFGRYQKRLLVLSTLAVFCVGWQNYITIFTLPKPKHRCAIPGYDNDTYEVHSPFHEQLINVSIPRNKKDGSLSKCEVMPPGNLSDPGVDPDNSTTKVKCQRWVYDQSVFRTTITGDLNLVCENSLYRSHAYMAMFSGKFVAGLSQGILSDLLGRRRLYLVSALLLVCASVLNIFINSVPLLLAARFLAAMSATATYLSIYVLVVEVLGRSQRKMTSIILQFMMVVSYILLTGSAYFLRDWRNFTISLAVPSFLLLPAWWLMEESPRWLLSKGKKEEAVKVITKIAAINHVTLTPEQLAGLGQDAPGHAPKPWLAFTRWRTAARYTALYCNWILVSMTFYGITLNVNNLRGDLYLNFLLLALVDLIALAICLFLLDRLGRKFIFCASTGLTGLALLALIIPIMVLGGNTWATHLSMRLLSLCGRMAMTAAYTTLYLYTAELWPTVLRNFGMGSSSTMSRCGAIVSPYVVEIGYFVKGNFSQGLPLIVFGACAIATAIITLFLPETIKRRLPESVEDARNFHIVVPDPKQNETETKEENTRV